MADIGARPSIRERLVAAYAIGWPVILRLYELDLAAFRPCTAPAETGCVVSFGTFGRDGEGRPAPPAAWSGEGLQCTNPLNGGAKAGPVAKRFNQGSLVRMGTRSELRPGLIDAECRLGALWATVPETSPWAARKLPPNSYHLVDYALYYANLREDARARVEAFLTARRPAPAGTESLRRAVP